MTKGSTIEPGKSVLDAFFGNREVGNIAKRGYCLRVALAGPTVTPRDKRFDYLLTMGQGALENILRLKPIGASELALVFPERWLSVHEQYCFVTCLDYNPDIKSGILTAVDIITQSLGIIGSVTDEEVSLFSYRNSRGHLQTELLERIAEAERKHGSSAFS